MSYKVTSYWGTLAIPWVFFGGFFLMGSLLAGDASYIPLGLQSLGVATVCIMMGNDSMKDKV